LAGVASTGFFWHAGLAGSKLIFKAVFLAGDVGLLNDTLMSVIFAKNDFEGEIGRLLSGYFLINWCDCDACFFFC
jgi:hypothetical protein